MVPAGPIDPSHKSHNASDKYPTMQHFVTEMCTHVHISVTKCCIMGYDTDAFWDLWNRAIDMRLQGKDMSKAIIWTNDDPVHWGIYASAWIGNYIHCKVCDIKNNAWVNRE